MRWGETAGVIVAVAAVTAWTTPYPATIGVNLGDVPFVDMVKSAGAWEAIGGGTLTGSDLDSNGWPRRDFRFLLLDSRPVAEWAGTIDDPTQYRWDYSGVYKGSFTGQASVSVIYTHGTVSNVQYNAATNTTTFDLTLPAPGSGYCFTVMQFTNTRRTASSATNTGITNLRIIRPGYGTNPTKVIADELFTALSHGKFTTIRAMGLTGTAMMPVTYPARTTWSSRKLLTDALWRPHNGKLDAAPWEVFIDLCNQANMDMWANIPISADTMYVRNLAQLIRDRLNSNLNVYIEIDNEVWGYDNPKNYNAAEALAKGLPNPLMNLAQRIVEAARTFESVFGAGSLTTRVRPVLAWWILNRGDVQNMLNYINSTYGPVNEIIYAIAPAMYFSVGETLENSTNASVHQLSMAMFADITSQIPSRQLWVNLATSRGLKGGLICYEGGPHTPSANYASAPNLATKITMHRTEHMAAQILYNLREAYFELGAQTFMYFTLSSSYSRYGCWGITDDLKYPDRNSKFRPIRELHGLVATPLPPGRFRATRVDAGTIQLSWTDYSDNETGFIIETIDSVTGNLIGGPDTVPAGTTTRTYTGLPSTSGRVFHLRAFNAAGSSTYTRALPQAATAVSPAAVPGNTLSQAMALVGSVATAVAYGLDGRAVARTDQHGFGALGRGLRPGLYVVCFRGSGGGTSRALIASGAQR